MKLNTYPCSTHLVEDIYKRACGEHGGILQSVIVRPIKYAKDLNILSISGQMPHYHKVVIDPSLDMQYHLTGYGTFYEEAVIRLVGEAIERYSLIVSNYALKDKMEFATYSQMEKKGKVIPFELIDLFTDEDYVKLNQGMYGGIRKLTKDDVIGWIKCPSLLKKDEEIWVPLQFLFVGYRVNQQANEVRFTPGFSTGTAAHKSLEKALSSAILELVEIDALMVNWYTKRKAPQVIVDDKALLEEYIEILGEKSNFDVINYDLSVLDSIKAHVFGTAIINKKEERPLIVYGAQGSLHPLKGLYRSFMEALAIEFLGVFGPLFAPKEYYADPTGDTFTDLDKNVSYWCNPSKAAEKKELFYKMAGDKIPLSSMPNYETDDPKEDLKSLIKDISEFSEYAVYLDVTPPESRELGWYVMRVFIPELITMCVPGVPYGNHPRFREFGGISNELPHPLP